MSRGFFVYSKVKDNVQFYSDLQNVLFICFIKSHFSRERLVEMPAENKIYIWKFSIAGKPQTQAAKPSGSCRRFSQRSSSIRPRDTATADTHWKVTKGNDTGKLKGQTGTKEQKSKKWANRIKGISGSSLVRGSSQKATDVELLQWAPAASAVCSVIGCVTCVGLWGRKVGGFCVSGVLHLSDNASREVRELCRTCRMCDV